MPSLRPFQREDVDAIKAAGLRALNASAPGTGKTAVTLSAIYELVPNTLPALIVCPASVTLNWAEEAATWCPGVDIVIIDSTTTPIPKTRKRCLYIMSWGLLDLRLEDLLQARIRVLVADEAHYSKNEEAARTKALTLLSESAHGSMLLTGTPVVNDSAELAVLKRIVGTDEPLMLRRLLEDVAPDIPPKSRSYLYVGLREKHRKAYNHADKEFEAWLLEEKERLLGEGRADREVAKIMAAEGFAKIGYLRRLVAEYKVAAAADWISRAVRLGEPVVVFCEHQNVLKRLSKALHRQRIRHGILDGSTPAKQRKQLVDDFQNLAFPVFIGTKAAKEGITLTRARHLLFVERFYTAADEEQAEDRIRRIGQTEETTIWFLHAVDTVDDRLDAIVSTKRRLVRTVIGSATVAETPMSAVEELIQDWQQRATCEREKLDLGLGDALPPLPDPTVTHRLVFDLRYWSPSAALVWARMNGYKVQEVKKDAQTVTVIPHRYEEFAPRAFFTEAVSPTITAICGIRKGRVRSAGA